MMNKAVEFIQYAKKFCVALIAALGILSNALADGHVSSSEWISVAVAFLGALGVYAVTNAKQP